MPTALIDVRVDASNAIALLTLGRKRLDYAAVNAVNDTAKRVQAAEVARVNAAFHLRDKRQFIERQAAIIKPFANVAAQRFAATISVGQKERLLLSGFEAGGARPKTSQLPSRGVAVPIAGGPARPSTSSPIPAGYRFTGLKLTRTTTRSNKAQIRGAHRTFITKTHALPLGGVFQRVGPGRGDIRLVYAFARNLRLKPVLEFVRTAQTTANRWFKFELEKQVKATFEYQASRGLR